MSDRDKKYSESMNNNKYFDCLPEVKRNFHQFSNVEIMQGFLPKSLSRVDFGKISYAHIDLNIACIEIDTINILEPHFTKGAHIVLDDYAFRGHEEQYDAWNDYVRIIGRYICTLPTGQGLIII